MKTTRAELRLECLLAALERELLEATDEEISTAAHELGIRPAMKGSIALFGVTRAAPLRNHADMFALKRPDSKKTPTKIGLRRRPKGNPPSST